nr:hypothetical protein [Planctomycetota bacterium]
MNTSYQLSHPLYPSVIGTATWQGEFKAIRNGENQTDHTDREYATHQDLALSINFATRKARGFVRNGASK